MEGQLDSVADDVRVTRVSTASVESRKRTRATLRLLYLALSSPEEKNQLPSQRRELQDLVARWQAKYLDREAELERYHLRRPTTRDEWRRLGELVEMPAERLRSGNWGIPDVLEHALIWAERHKIKASLEADARAEANVRLGRGDSRAHRASRPRGGSTEHVSANPSGLQRLLRLFMHGVADARIAQAVTILQNEEFTVDDKLMKIDELVPLPARASAKQLGALLGVSKQAVLKSQWWDQNRKGEKGDEVGKRHHMHRERAKRREPRPAADEDVA